MDAITDPIMTLQNVIRQIFFSNSLNSPLQSLAYVGIIPVAQNLEASNIDQALWSRISVLAEKARKKAPVRSERHSQRNRVVGAENWPRRAVSAAGFPGKAHASLKLSQMEAFMGKILPTRRHNQETLQDGNEVGVPRARQR